MQLDEKKERLMKITAAISEKRKTGRDTNPDDMEILSVDGKPVDTGCANRFHLLLNDKIIAASIIGISIIVYGLIGLFNHGWRYENKSTSSMVQIFDRKTGSLFTSNGHDLKEIAVSDKKIIEHSSERKTIRNVKKDESPKASFPDADNDGIDDRVGRRCSAGILIYKNAVQ